MPHQSREILPSHLASFVSVSMRLTRLAPLAAVAVVLDIASGAAVVKSTQQKQVDQCHGRLQLLQGARTFCQLWLQGKKPVPSTTLTYFTTKTSTPPAAVSTVLSTSTLTSTSTVTSTSTIYSTPVTLVTTTVETDIVSTSTVVAPAQRRAAAAVPQASTVTRLYPASTITDACLLFLYGQIHAPATSTTLTSKTTLAAQQTTTSCEYCYDPFQLPARPL